VMFNTSFDYHPLGRAPSFIFLLLVLFGISTSLSILVNLLSLTLFDSRCLVQLQSSTVGSKESTDPEYVVPTTELYPNVALSGKTHRTKFTSEPEWEEWTMNVTQQWETMLPNDPLGQDESFNDGIPYGLGMFHQVHCLHEIRVQYSALLEVDGTTNSEREYARTDVQRKHIGHCFNWIRQVSTLSCGTSLQLTLGQALLCHADSHREVLVESATGGNTEKYARICGDAASLYDQVGVRGQNKKYT
jgi:hypothetical protein